MLSPPSHLSPILITKHYGLSCYCGLRPTSVAWESLNVGSNVFAFSTCIYPSGQEMSEHSTALIWDHRVKRKIKKKKIELLSSTWEERKVLRRNLQCASAFLITQASHVCWLLHPVCAHRRKKPLGVVESFLFPLLFPSQNVSSVMHVLNSSQSETLHNDPGNWKAWKPSCAAVYVQRRSAVTGPTPSSDFGEYGKCYKLVSLSLTTH